MKKRNQLVSALLTGVLLGGAASGTIGTTPLRTAAEESSAGDESDYAFDEGESAGDEDGGYESDVYSDYETDLYSEDDGNESFEEDSTGSYEEDQGGDDGSDVTGEGEPDSGTESTTGSDESGSETEFTDSGAESDVTDTDSGSDPFSGTTESGTPESEGTESEGTESGGTGSEAESQLTEEEAQALDEAEAERIRREEEEELARLEAESQEAAAADQAIENEIEKTDELILEETRASEQEIIDQAREELQQKAEEQAAEAKAAEEERRAEAAVRYGYAASDRAYYSGSYFVTNAQKRLALNVGFKKIDKVPAMPVSQDGLNIFEEMNADSKIVGTMNTRDICYIIDDTNVDWLYVESGEVRGFAARSALKTGKEVEAYVNVVGETGITLAEQKVDPLENAAYRYSLNTTKDVASILQALGTAAVDRQAMIQFGMQFLGNPYVWGGESLTNGCDCSGFTQQVYAQFGVALPRTSYQQAEVGVKIPAEEAVPGDLLFYSRDGVVYHVLMYIGDGKAVNASSSSTGIIVSDVDYAKVCWGCRYISDTGVNSTGAQMNTSTQASALQAIGQMAYSGDAAAQEEIINALAQASMKEWKTYGFCRSVIIAQAIDESGWLSFGTSAAGIQSTDNNILGMNEELNNSQWTSPWDGKAATRLVPQYSGGENVLNFESMRLYDDMETCMEDYAAFKIGLHPDLIGETDVDKVIAVGLKGYATNPNYQSDIRSIIDKYDLTRFDQEETAALPAELFMTETTLPAEDNDFGSENEIDTGFAGGIDAGSDEPYAVMRDLPAEGAGRDDAFREESGAATAGLTEDKAADRDPDEVVFYDESEGMPEEQESFTEPDQPSEPETTAEPENPTGTEAGTGVKAVSEADRWTFEEELLLANLPVTDPTPVTGGAPMIDPIPVVVLEDGSIVPAVTAEETGETGSSEAEEAEKPAGELDGDQTSGEVNGDQTSGEVNEDRTAGEATGLEVVRAAQESENGTDAVTVEFGTDGTTVENGISDDTNETGPYVGPSGNISTGDPDEVAASAAAGSEAEAPVEGGEDTRVLQNQVTDYTDEQLELIWAVVAEADDTSYDGALAVISSVMNRADVNYGGFGTNAYDQLTARGQYACSPEVEDPLFYQRRLGGNVPDFVKQAISDCLTNGIRNNDYTSFRSGPTVGGSAQIGANWYFTDAAGNEQEALANMADIIGDVAAEVTDTAEDTYYYSYEPYQDYEGGENFEEAFETAAEANPDAFDQGDELINEQPPEDDAEEVVFFEDPDLA